MGLVGVIVLYLNAFFLLIKKMIKNKLFEIQLLVFPILLKEAKSMYKCFFLPAHNWQKNNDKEYSCRAVAKLTVPGGQSKNISSTLSSFS